MNIKILKFFAFVIIISCCSCGDKTVNSSKFCMKCHRISNLGGEGSTKITPFENMVENGKGITGGASFDPTEPVSYSTGWVKRGFHSQDELNDCSGCHEVDVEGTSHGGFYYPEKAINGLYSSYCALNCHNYLSDDLKPEMLFSQCSSSNSHRLILENGFSSSGPSLKVSYISPGCGGCHSLKEFRHGYIPDCFDCHVFNSSSNGLHVLHVDINGNQSCNLCHVNDETNLYKASCYNCHFSGHCP